MKNANRKLFSLIAVLLFATACAQQPPAPPPDTRPADEAAINALVKEWDAAAQAKDAEKFVSFYADDAVLMLHGMVPASGKAAIADGMKALMQDPNFALTFAADHVEVARSGDFAFEGGTYTITVTDMKSKKPTTEKGHYLVVWKKAADGKWQVYRDVPVSEATEPAAKM